MKKIWSTAYYEFKRNIRDVKMMLIFIITPIILLFILGTSLESFITMKDMPTPIVGYINEDEGEVSKTFDLFLEQNSIKQILEIKKYSSKEEAENDINDGKIGSVIFISSSFSELISQGEKAEIEVSGKKDSTYVSAVIQSYVNYYNLNAALMVNQMEPTNQFEKITVERLELSKTPVYPKTMDYYAIQTLIQILILCGVFGIAAILRDYDGGMFIRINSLPIKRYQLLIGRLIGSIVYSFLAAIITILFSKYVYKANWDGNVLIIGSAILLFVVVAVGLGALFALLTKSYISSFGIIGLLSFIFAASVGAFSPKSTIKEIAIVSPNLYTKNIILATVFKLNTSIIINGFISLFIMIIIIYGLIILLEGRKKYENI